MTFDVPALALQAAADGSEHHRDHHQHDQRPRRTRASAGLFHSRQREAPRQRLVRRQERQMPARRAARPGPASTGVTSRGVGPFISRGTLIGSGTIFRAEDQPTPMRNMPRLSDLLRQPVALISPRSRRATSPTGCCCGPRFGAGWAWRISRGSDRPGLAARPRHRAGLIVGAEPRCIARCSGWPGRRFSADLCSAAPWSPSPRGCGSGLA